MFRRVMPKEKLEGEGTKAREEGTKEEEGTEGQRDKGGSGMGDVYVGVF